MSTREIELEIKKKEIELRLLRKKLSVIQAHEPKTKDQGLIAIAEKYQSEFSKITDEDIDEVINEWDKISDNWDKG